jgi:5'-nucleotidase
MREAEPRTDSDKGKGTTMRKVQIAIGLAALIACAAAAPASARPDNSSDARTIDVQLLAVNDFHGNLQPPSGSSGLIQGVPAGGMEYMATHLRQLEATNPKNTVIVSAGDLIGASPLLSGLFHDEPTIEAWNLAGLDYNGVGNHEFDEGKAELRRMQNGRCHPVDGCQDGTPFFGSVFQFLAANVVDTSTNNPLFPEFKIERLQGVKVAFIGETLEGTPLIVTPAGVDGLTFLDEADTVNMLVPRLKEKGVETIVVLLHEGGFQASPSDYNGCNNLGGAIVDIVDRMSDEVDVVISAHTHQPYNCVVDGKVVTSASSFGRLITDVDLGIDRKTGEVVSKTARNVIVTRDVAKDAAQTALIDRYNLIAGPIANRVVGRITADITRSGNAAGESALGDVIADAQLAATAPTDFGGSKVAFMNPGGIRADLIFSQISGGEAPGEVTFGELFTVQPFANTLTVKTCTGAQIEQLLEQQGPRLQVSAGFTYTWDAARPSGDRIDPASIKIDGVTVVPATGYRVTMNSFLATGGDGFSVFNACTNQLGGEVDVDALARYFTENSPIAPGPQNRITRLN